MKDRKQRMLVALMADAGMNQYRIERCPPLNQQRICSVYQPDKKNAIP